MNYLKLNGSGTKWDIIDVNKIDLKDYNQVKLYDEKINFVGIGLYKEKRKQNMCQINIELNEIEETEETEICEGCGKEVPLSDMSDVMEMYICNKCEEFEDEIIL